MAASDDRKRNVSRKPFTANLRMAQVNSVLTINYQFAMLLHMKRNAKPTSFTMKPEVKQQLKRLADASDCTMSAYLVALIKRESSKLEKKILTV